MAQQQNDPSDPKRQLGNDPQASSETATDKYFRLARATASATCCSATQRDEKWVLRNAPLMELEQYRAAARLRCACSMRASATAPCWTRVMRPMARPLSDRAGRRVVGKEISLRRTCASRRRKCPIVSMEHPGDGARDDEHVLFGARGCGRTHRSPPNKWSGTRSRSKATRQVASSARLPISRSSSRRAGARRRARRPATTDERPRRARDVSRRSRASCWIRCARSAVPCAPISIS